MECRKLELGQMVSDQPLVVTNDPSQSVSLSPHPISHDPYFQFSEPAIVRSSRLYIPTRWPRGGVWLLGHAVAVSACRPALLLCVY